MTTDTGTFTPRPGAAPLRRQVLAQASMESRLMVRNGEQLLLALVIPLLVLVGGVAGAHRIGIHFDERAVDALTPGVLALAVMSTAFTSLAIATGFERRYGVIKRLGASPLSRTGLLAGKISAVLAVQAIQLAVLIGTGFALGWNPVGGADAVLGVILTVLCGTAAFASLGLLMAGVLRAEATLAAANLLYLLLLVGGAVLTPVDEYPAGMQGVVRLLPSAALANGIANSTIEGVIPWAAALSLALWAAVLGYLVSRTFRWD